MDLDDSHVSSPISVTRSAWRWWRETAVREGHSAATRKLLIAVCEFVRDSTPQRRRQRYGDADYDWDHRVNTTSAALNWRDRLLGVFHSPYQPTEYILLHEMLHLKHRSRVDDSRLILHTAEFKAEEKRFRDYGDAKLWLRRI